MTDVSGTLELIQEFVTLAMSRRTKALAPESKRRIDVLDEVLRDAIDGARPQARRIEGAPAAAEPPAKTATPAPKTSTLDAFSKKLDLSVKDKKKLRQVSVDQLPKSAYTSSMSPSFLAAYYAEDIVPLDETSARKLVPTRVVGAEGESVDLSNEARVILGLPQVEGRPRAAVGDDHTDVTSGQTPIPGANVTRTSGNDAVPSASPAARTAAAPIGRPVIVHLLQGGVRRGQIEDFDATTGVVTFAGEGEATAIPLPEVLAIFFGLQKGEEAPAPSGQKVVVKLVNDRQVAGLTDDYEEGGDALTVMPEQRRGQVDRIWIPAWAVKEIQLG